MTKNAKHEKCLTKVSDLNVVPLQLFFRDNI